MEAVKRNVINQSCKLGLLDRLQVLTLLAKHKVTIVEHADGSRINIDTVPEEVLIEVDTLIKKLLNAVPDKYQF